MKIYDKNISFRYLTFDELIINLDRLSRFKLPDISYKRVFFDIILKCLNTPKFSKSDLAELDPKFVSNIVKKIWIESIKHLFGEVENNSNLLELTIKSTFKNLDNYTQTLISTKLPISQLLKHSDFEKLPINLKFLHNCINIECLSDIINESKNFQLLFPIRKLLIVEGITEEILLPVFADKLGVNFHRNGIFIIGSGGKSKSPVLYNDFKDKLKIPIVILFDSDAKDICSLLNSNLYKKDKLICLKNGEFEDIISMNLIKRTLNSEYIPFSPVTIPEIKLYNKRCDFLHEFFRTRQLGEFKKAKFAKLLSQNLKYDSDISEEIIELIKKII